MGAAPSRRCPHTPSLTVSPSLTRMHPVDHVTDTIPYPWPFDAAAGLTPHRLALVIVGAQLQWVDDATVDLLARLDHFAGAVRARGVLVVFTRHTRPTHPRRPRRDLPVPGEAGWELALTPNVDDVLVDSRGCDGFSGSPLDQQLRAHDRSHILFGGLASEVLVDSTLRSANDRGYECLTLRDCVAPISPDTGERVLASVTMSGGIFGAVGSSDAALAALASPSGARNGARTEEALT